MRSLRTLAAATVLLAGVALMFGGCKSGSRPTATVHGVVKYRGKPVTAGYVVFVSEGEAPEVRTPLGPNGEYRATGVGVGPCNIAIETRAFQYMTPPPRNLARGIGAGRPVYTPIPSKYERLESARLTHEIKSGDNSYDIDLP